MIQVFRQIIHYVIATFLVASLVPAAAVFASGEQLFVTPSTSQMNIGTIFTVNVGSYADSAATRTVSGTLTYSSNLLQVNSISTSGSDYGSLTITQGSGTIGFNGSGSPNSAIDHIFSVTFKAKAAGLATVTFSNDSVVNGSSTVYKSASFTLTDPNPTVSPTPSSKPKASPSPKPVPVVSTPAPTTDNPVDNSQPQTTTDPTGLIDSVVVTNSYSSSTITWRVNASNTSSALNYGASFSQLDKQASVKKNADGTFTATATNLLPGTNYYFSITARGTGVATGNYSGTIFTSGFPIEISITENKIPVKSAQISIGGGSHTVTDGKLTIGLAPGSYSGTITTATATLNINLTVEEKPIPADGSAPKVQAFGPYNLSSSTLAGGPGSGSTILAFVGVLIGGTIIFILAFLIYFNIRRRRFESGTLSHASTPTIIVEDGYDWQRDASPNVEQSNPSAEAIFTDSPELQAHQEHHSNSVYITDEEPIDMFDKPKILPSVTSDPTLDPPTVTPQNPS